jgi:hypothetical protein
VPPAAAGRQGSGGSGRAALTAGYRRSSGSSHKAPGAIRQGAQGVLADTMGQHASSTAVYAPWTPKDRAAFFLDEYEIALSSGTQQSQIVGGDFNCVMRAADVLPAAQQRPAASSRMVGGAQLRTVKFVNRLQDAWLLQHPHLPQPTHYTQHAGSTDSTGQQVQGDVSGGRIHYIFLSDDLIDAGWLQRTLQHRAPGLPPAAWDPRSGEGALALPQPPARGGSF